MPRLSGSRTCVGCGQREEPRALLRCTLTPDGTVVVDAKNERSGRGAWVHPRPACLERAVRGGLARTFRTAVEVSLPQLTRAIAAFAERRLTGLVQAARARRVLVFGRDAVQEALPRVRFALLAEDASRLAETPWVAALGASGKLSVWGKKDDFGAWLGRGDVAILAICDSGLAAQIAQSLALLRLEPVSVQDVGPTEQKSVSEVR